MIYVLSSGKVTEYENFSSYSQSAQFKDGQFCFVKNSYSHPDYTSRLKKNIPWALRKGSEFVVVQRPDGCEYHRVFVPKAFYVPVIRCAGKTFVLAQDYFGDIKKGLNFAGHARNDIDPLIILRRIFKVSDRGSSKTQIEVKGEAPITRTTGLKVTGSKDKKAKADLNATLETRLLSDNCQLNILTIDLSRLNSLDASEKLKNNVLLNTFHSINISQYRKNSVAKFVKDNNLVPAISAKIAKEILDRKGSR